MTQQNEALRLADDLIYVSKYSDSEHWNTLAETATELRRLYAENESLKNTLAASCDEEREQLYEANPGGGCARALSAEFQRDALLEALTELVGHNKRFTGGAWDRARAVIKAVEEKT